MSESLIWKVYELMEVMTKEALDMPPVEFFKLLDHCVI